jgi:hypothetical protein
MNKHKVLLSALIAPALLVAATAAAADAETTAVTSAATTAPGHWLVRAEGSLVGMRDNWLSLPAPEMGLTVGRDVAPRFSVELTGSVRDVGDDHRRSWSALAALRGAAVTSADGQHALTIAAGPFLEIDNVVHGTLPFAHGELAYVFRAPRGGLTVLAGAGVNVALATSPYVTPPSPCATPNTGDSPTFCIDLGPNAQEIHPGDASIHLRVAAGWQF